MNPDQPALLNLDSSAKLPRRKLGRGSLALLILLRIYVALAIPMVAYAFIKAVWQ
jgi:hypothetical protein